MVVLSICPPPTVVEKRPENSSTVSAAAFAEICKEVSASCVSAAKEAAKKQSPALRVVADGHVRASVESAVATEVKAVLRREMQASQKQTADNTAKSLAADFASLPSDDQTADGVDLASTDKGESVSGGGSSSTFSTPLQTQSATAATGISTGSTGRASPSGDTNGPSKKNKK